MVGRKQEGAEIAAALRMHEKDVTMIFPEKTILERLFPAELGQYVNRYYREKGVEVDAEDLPQSFEATEDDRYVITSQNGKRWEVDGVIAGIGVRPNVALAQQAGLSTENGILVNEYLQTDDPEIYAAGDVANFYAPALGRRLRVEHEENATFQGRLAGENMAGAQKPHLHLPFFYSDMFELGYEAVGVLDPRLHVVEDWVKPYEEGVVYYLDEDRLVGVLNWNVWDKVGDARKLLESGERFADAASLIGRIRNR
ncbi:MAG: FAD-dependent oxidoreductase [Firmicutes bacterium]|nr:FAD-dependent oxidoreductase [Bacillota bacterium]